MDWKMVSMKAVLLKKEEKHYLLVILHHLIVDGVSWRIFEEDLNTVLKQIRREKRLVWLGKQRHIRNGQSAGRIQQ